MKNLDSRIGELCKEGKTVYYAFICGYEMSNYFEGSLSAVERRLAAFDNGPVEEGDCIDIEINQGVRNCEVLEIKRTRFRIEYEMPNAGMMKGWQDGFWAADKFYYLKKY